MSELGAVWEDVYEKYRNYGINSIDKPNYNVLVSFDIKEYAPYFKYIIDRISEIPYWIQVRVMQKILRGERVDLFGLGGVHLPVGKLAESQDHINPSHYKAGKVECIDALESATINKQGLEAVCVANVIKYLWRYEAKGGLQDVKKAQWYLERLISHMESI